MSKPKSVLPHDVVTYRKEAVKAAGELCYGKEIITKLKRAKTNSEISRILKTARKGD